MSDMSGPERNRSAEPCLILSMTRPLRDGSVGQPPIPWRVICPACLASSVPAHAGSWWKRGAAQAEIELPCDILGSRDIDQAGAIKNFIDV